MNDTLYIVMPTYNEESNIRKVVQEWYPILDKGSEDSRLVIADGGSNDKTFQILNELKNDFPKLEILQKKNTDHGTKVILLYKYALKNGAKWIFQTDSDGQTLPEEFNMFWELKEQFDAILGNRKRRGDGISRKIVENVLRMYLLVFLGVMVPDANAPFRLMKNTIVKKYIEILPNDFNLPNAILSACFSKYNEKVAYRVITFQPRQGGKNHMNFKKIMKIGAQSVTNFMLINKRLNAYTKVTK